MNNVDVLAVMDAEISAAMDACKSTHGSARLTSLYEARAAVAELIEAAEQMAEATGGDRCRCRANLRAALARVQGGAA